MLECKKRLDKCLFTSLSKILEVFCHINSYLLMFINFCTDCRFQCNLTDLYFLMIYLYVYILDIICFVTVLVLCVVDPLPARPGACCIARIQPGESKSMFFLTFCFILMLFTVCHLICLASDCLQRYMHGNVTLCIRRVSVSCQNNSGKMSQKGEKKKPSKH